MIKRIGDRKGVGAVLRKLAVRQCVTKQVCELGSGNVSYIFLLLKWRTPRFMCSHNSDLFYSTKENQMVEIPPKK